MELIGPDRLQIDPAFLLSGSVAELTPRPGWLIFFGHRDLHLARRL